VRYQWGGLYLREDEIPNTKEKHKERYVRGKECDAVERVVVRLDHNNLGYRRGGAGVRYRGGVKKRKDRKEEKTEKKTCILWGKE